MAQAQKATAIRTLTRVKPVRSLRHQTKFEIYGEEMLEKKVNLSGRSGRVYVPLEWLGKHVKIIRVD